MKPNEAHIAHLILAFQDGTITSSEKAQLDALILAYPEYAQDLEPVNLPEPKNEIFPNSNLMHLEFEILQIYKQEDGHPYDKLAIGSLEGLLNTDELLLETSLQQDAFYIKNKQKYVQTILNPDESIVYPIPNNLIKKAPVRRLTFKKIAVTMSSAAAILLAIWLIGENSPAPTSVQIKKPTFAQNPNAKKTSVKMVPELTLNGKQKQNQGSLTPLQLAVIYPHETIEPEKRDCIVAVQDPKVNDLQYVYSKPEVCSKNKEYDQDLSTTSENSILPALNQTPLPTFRKEPITVKAFLIQKTNERLFGTPAPTTDLRYETMAHYASQTIGLPVRYAVESGAAADKIVFQLGPISIERTKSKK